MSEEIIEDVDGDYDEAMDVPVASETPPDIGKQLPPKKNRKSLLIVLALLVAIVTLSLILTLVVFKPKEASGDALNTGGDNSDNDASNGDSNGGSNIDPDPEQPPVDVDPSTLWPHELSDIPLDPNLHVGELDNGLRYMIYPHADPLNEINMRMHVDVGSLHEDIDQLGYVLRHLTAFRNR